MAAMPQATADFVHFRPRRFADAWQSESPEELPCGGI